MSKRRKPGDIVGKKPYAGFIGIACVVRIEPEMDGYESPCWGLNGCTDPKCVEWSNCEVIVNGEVVGMACHVSECEMEDLPRTRIRAIAQRLRDREVAP